MNPGGEELSRSASNALASRAVSCKNPPDVSASVGGLVVARRAAGFAVHQSVDAHPDVDNRLTKAAILLTLAIPFGLFALRAAIFGLAGSGTHYVTVSLTRGSANVTSVTPSRRPMPDARRLILSLPYNSKQ